MLRLELSGISKSYNGKPVLAGCSFKLNGGVYAVMGANGSGKSTLLRICALLEPPDGGSVRYFSGNEMLSENLSLRRRITLVLPKPAIFNSTVYGNAAYGLKVRGVSRAVERERAHEALKTVGLHEMSGRNALTLSSGEAQRLALARALAVGPEALFLDEPTASVDEENTEVIEGLISRMRTAGGPTVIMATHDRQQAERLSDGIVILRGGRLEAGLGSSSHK